jgi:RNA polymerase sigma-70 factor (ECF subfamily)
VEQKPTAKILDGAAKEDRKCQESLYKTYYSYGMSICLRYSAHREEALEILHDGFMKLFSHIQQYDRERSFTAWFRKILINAALNHYKKNLKHTNQVGLELIPEMPDLQKNIISELEYTHIVTVVQSLPSAYRTVFNLYVMEGYSHEEIADMLEISIGTSKSNLSRARLKLRKMLTPRDHEKAYIRHE